MQTSLASYAKSDQQKGVEKKNSQTQPPSDFLPDPLLILASSLTPHLGGLHVGRTLIVGLRQHAHDGDQDLLDALDG